MTPARLLSSMLVFRVTSAVAAESPSQIPDDFPRFSVPGHETEMAALRELFWLHYPGAGPKAKKVVYTSWVGPKRFITTSPLLNTPARS